MNNIIWYLLGFFSYWALQTLTSMKKDPEIIKSLTTQVETLQERLYYYKNLCLWHVQEKDKLLDVIKDLEGKK
jgi:hypothetical protein